MVVHCMYIYISSSIVAVIALVLVGIGLKK